MPRFSVWSIRIGLLYLVIGFTFGALMLANKGMPFSPSVWRLLPIHIEVLLVGWLVQLAMGVAFWILPRFSQAPRRGNEKLAWSGLVILNLGILSVAFGDIATGLIAHQGFLVAGRAFEIAGAAVFALNFWPRLNV